MSLNRSSELSACNDSFLLQLSLLLLTLDILASTPLTAMESTKHFDDVATVDPPPPYRQSDPGQNVNASSGTIALDKDYLKSILGILKALEIVLYITILICVGIGVHAYTHLRGVAIWALIWTVLLYSVLATSLRAQMSVIHWPATDFLSTGLHFTMMLIGSIVAAAHGNQGNSADDAAIAFGFITTAVLGCHCYLGYNDFRSFVDKHQASRRATAAQAHGQFTTTVTTVQEGGVVTERTVTTVSQ